MERKFYVLKGEGPKESTKEQKLVADFKRIFKTTLKERGVLNDFSLNKVVEESLKGKTDFIDHEKEVYDKIQDLLKNPPIAEDSYLPLPEEQHELERAA